MKKKIVSLMMATTLAAGLLSGCGGDKAPADSGTDTNASTNTDASAGGDTGGGDAAADAGSSDAAGAALPAMTTDEITLTYMHFDSEQLVNQIGRAHV